MKLEVHLRCDQYPSGTHKPDAFLSPSVFWAARDKIEARECTTEAGQPATVSSVDTRALLWIYPTAFRTDDKIIAFFILMTQTKEKNHNKIYKLCHRINKSTVRSESELLTESLSQDNNSNVVGSEESGRETLLGHFEEKVSSCHFHFIS